MGKTPLAWAGGAVIILILLIVIGGKFLSRKYCWDCTASERYARGTELLCSKNVETRAIGLKQVFRAASQGVPEALSLAGELYLRPLPKRYIPTHRGVLSCLGDWPTGDRQKAASYFEALAGTDELTPELEYNLGVLLDMGVLPEPVNRTADDYYRGAAQRGEPLAMYELGLKADQQKNHTEAARWFKEAFSRSGHPGAALTLGDYAFYGRLGEADPEQALLWYQKVLDAVKNPAFAGIGEAFALKARNRLAMVNSYQQRTGGKEAIVVSYRLAGEFDEYRVHAADTGVRIGCVVREGEVVKATFQVGDSAEGPIEEEREVASMNDGLNWLLETYAAGQYGSGKKFRFVLVPN